MSPGVDTALFTPEPKQRRIVVELRPNERTVARGVIHALPELPGWEVVLLRTRPLIGRPAIPRALAGRVRVRTARDAETRASLLNSAAIFVPGVAGLRRVTLEASAAGCAIAHPAGVQEQPELAAAATARLASDDAFREREGAAARARRSARISPTSPRSSSSSTRRCRAGGGSGRQPIPSPTGRG